MTTTTERRVTTSDTGGFDVFKLESGIDGPHVVVLGGVHGDETHGVLAAGRLAHSPLPLSTGTVTVVPVCHESAFLADSRFSADDNGNLARVFPGKASGQPTEMLAHGLYTEVLQHADLLIDLHTSGQSMNMPFLVGYHGPTATTDSLAARSAAAFGAPLVWRHPSLSPGRTVSVVDQAIYTECPGGGPMTTAAVDAYVDGVIRVLASLGMVNDAPPPPGRPPVHVTGDGDTDNGMVAAACDGLFLTDLTAGRHVDAGDQLGTIVDVAGRTLHEIQASEPGVVMALRRRPPVSTGDQLVSVASYDDADYT